MPMANDIYDFHSSVIKFAIQWHHRARTNALNPSMWWPDIVIPQWRDNYSPRPKGRTPREVCKGVSNTPLRSHSDR
ncbi:hypothetical protein V8E54_006661 [Elaphomyces granulatus]